MDTLGLIAAVDFGKNKPIRLLLLLLLELGGGGGGGF